MDASGPIFASVALHIIAQSHALQASVASNDGFSIFHIVSIALLSVEAFLIVPAPVVINAFFHTGGGLLIFQQITQEPVYQAVLWTFVIFTVLPFCMQLGTVLYRILRRPHEFDPKKMN